MKHAREAILSQFVTNRSLIMFYATRTQQRDVELRYGTETHILKFYSKANRAAYLAEHPDARVIPASECRRVPWFRGYTANLDGCVYFGCIV